MAVEDDPDVNAAPLGVDEGVDHAVMVLPAQLADQKQNELDRVLGAVNFGNDGVMRAIVLPAQRGVTPERVQQIEMTVGVDAVTLNHAAAHALKDVVEQPADAARAKRHAGFPVRPPPVEGDVERADYDILVAEDDELVMHIRGNLDRRILGRAKDPQKFSPRPLQPHVVVAVGQCHLAPVDDALHPDPVPMSMDQVINEIRVVDAINTNLDGLLLMRVFMLLADRRIDAFVNIWFGMIRVIGLAFGEFGREVQRLEIVVAPVRVPLQRPALACGTR